MSKRILIVEDEESIADLEKDYLELSGFEVEVANDGETAPDNLSPDLQCFLHLPRSKYVYSFTGTS